MYQLYNFGNDHTEEGLKEKILYARGSFDGLIGVAGVLGFDQIMTDKVIEETWIMYVQKLLEINTDVATRALNSLGFEVSPPYEQKKRDGFDVSLRKRKCVK